MIKNIRVGNILSPENDSDIIIGMNLQFKDVLGIGKPFVDRIVRTRDLRLGSVISFEHDDERELHMLVCHRIGKCGWKDAEQFVRYGMDYLWQKRPDRKYSIVNIGTGLTAPTIVGWGQQAGRKLSESKPAKSGSGGEERKITMTEPSAPAQGTRRVRRG